MGFIADGLGRCECGSQTAPEMGLLVACAPASCAACARAFTVPRLSLGELQSTGGRFQRAERGGVVLGLVLVVLFALTLCKAVWS